MNKKSIFAILSISILAIVFSIFQSTRQIDLTSAAYSSARPANGHSWTEMECNSSLCVTGGNIGIGTDSPTVKLEVSGTVKATDVCNSSGICLSNFSSITNSCGTAAKTYSASDTAYSGTYCFLGSPTPTTPSFPDQGGSTTWTCPVSSGSPMSCTATRTLPVNGVCGTANGKVYNMTVTSYGSDTICSSGTYDTPSFPTQSNITVSWTCTGTGGGTSANCSASVKNCASAGGTVYSCGSSGSCCMFSGSDVSCPSGWSQLGSWSTTTPSTAYSTIIPGSDGNNTFCDNACPSVGGHAWSNTAQEYCVQYNCMYSTCWSGCIVPTTYHYAPRTQIGCY